MLRTRSGSNSYACHYQYWPRVRCATHPIQDHVHAGQQGHDHEHLASASMIYTWLAAYMAAVFMETYAISRDDVQRCMYVQFRQWQLPAQQLCCIHWHMYILNWVYRVQAFNIYTAAASLLGSVPYQSCKLVAEKNMQQQAQMLKNAASQLKSFDKNKSAESAQCMQIGPRRL